LPTEGVVLEDLGSAIGQKYKCKACMFIIKEEDLEEGACPECGRKPEKMCKNDRMSCSHPHEDVSSIIKYCDECGEPMCPVCGCHDVLILSRITGYIQDLKGFNAAKFQEVKDRTRYDVTTPLANPLNE
jgi:hypothetical protein